MSAERFGGDKGKSMKIPYCKNHRAVWIKTSGRRW